MGHSIVRALAGHIRLFSAAADRMRDQRNTRTHGDRGGRANERPDRARVRELDVAIDGGRTLHLVCTGPASSTRPTVVFEEGLADATNLGRRRDYELTRRHATHTTAPAMARAPPRRAAHHGEPGGRSRQAHRRGIDFACRSSLLGGRSAAGTRWSTLTGTRVALPVSSSSTVPPPTGAPRGSELPPEVPGELEALAGNRDEFTSFETDPSRNTEALDIHASAAQVAATSFGGVPVRFLWAEADCGAVGKGPGSRARRPARRRAAPAARGHGGARRGRRELDPRRCRPRHPGAGATGDHRCHSRRPWRGWRVASAGGSRRPGATRPRLSTPPSCVRSSGSGSATRSPRTAATSGLIATLARSASTRSSRPASAGRS